MLATWSWGVRRGLATGARRHRRRPAVEPMEPRQLLSTVTEINTFSLIYPDVIVSGPDGNLWFAGGENVNQVGTINPNTHAFSMLSAPVLPGADAIGIEGITLGPDGNLWFTEPWCHAIGMINPTTHAVAQFPLPTPHAFPWTITVGVDGNLWFTEEWTSHAIGMINPTTHVINEYPVPTQDGDPGSRDPFGIAAGPDGNLWFTEPWHDQLGTINPTTHAITVIPLSTPNAFPWMITTGPDGNLWFTEEWGDKIATIDPRTYRIVETGLPAADSAPMGITTGPDGNLWFTEYGIDKIGSMNPVTRGITETAIPTARANPTGITTGPDGKLWFTEASNYSIAVLTPTPAVPLYVTTEPPAVVAPNAPFGLTVSVFDRSGLPDTAYNGDVTLILENNGPGGVTLGGTLTVAAHDGVASFSGLTIDQAGTGYRIMAYADSLTSALTTPVTVAVPPPPSVTVAPRILAEKETLTGEGRHRHVVGFELDFSAAMDPTRAASVANYIVTQFRRRHRQLVARPVHFRAAYDAATRSVTLTLAGRPKFARGGRLEVIAGPSGGLTDAAGVPLGGETFAIAPNRRPSRYDGRRRDPARRAGGSIAHDDATRRGS
jgi:streptogramin lyase